jgi:rhodanese-related sulfurtransferase
MQNKNYIYLILGIILGCILAVSFRQIRYSEYILPSIKEIDPKSAYENITKNKDDVIFIDVRSEGEYLSAHASGSINLPIHYMYDDTHGLPNEKGIPLPKNNNQEIYLICTGGRLAGVAYSYLEHYGYRNIKRVKGGISNWNTEGLPVITKPIFGNDFKEKSYVSPPLDKPYATSTTKN